MTLDQTIENDALTVENVSHWFGQTKVLNNVNLRIAAGQIVALVGPSGCGKSTLLRAILGTHPPSAGRILSQSVEIRKPSRAVGIVYQHYSLYDFLTARDNVAFGPKLDQTSLLYRLTRYRSWRKLREQHRKDAIDFLDRVGLERAVNQFPHEMSGGMKQRVAIAQAMIMRPGILLLDEPFGALDETTRADLQMMLLRFYQENLHAKVAGERPPHTILMVTHELNEALYVSDRVVGLSQYHSDGANGATIVYDRPSPVFHPDDPRDFDSLVHQREELRSVVFSEEANRQHSKYVTFWDEVRSESATTKLAGQRQDHP